MSCSHSKKLIEIKEYLSDFTPLYLTTILYPRLQHQNFYFYGSMYPRQWDYVLSSELHVVVYC